MVALRFLLRGNRYNINGDVVRDQLVGHVPDIMREISRTGPLGIAVMTALRAFLPFITTMDARSHDRIPPDYQAIRKAKQDVTIACLNYWFDQTWADLAGSTWDIKTDEVDGNTWISGLTPVTPAVVENGGGGANRFIAAGNAELSVPAAVIDAEH